MAALRIIARFVKDGKQGEVVAEVPFENGKYELPEVYPFTKNVYLGPDSGYSLGWIAIQKEEMRLHFGYAETIVLDEEGKGHFLLESKTGENIELEFTLI